MGCAESALGFFEEPSSGSCVVPQQDTPVCGMSLSAGPVPQEGQHSPGTGGNTCSKSHLTSRLPFPSPSTVTGICCQERFEHTRDPAWLRAAPRRGSGAI